VFYESISDINFTISVDQKVKFIADEFRLNVILNNILSNSIKYQKKDNDHKQVKILVTVSEQDAQIVIEDNGIGVPQKYQDRIFNMFFRATDHGQGSGIGLYIVKEAIEKINGEIQLESDETKGTTFKITIPNRINELKEN
jgi:signal transduction histidine kinase